MKVALTGAAGFTGLAGAFSLLMIPALQAAGRWINTGQTYGRVLDGQLAGHCGCCDLAAGRARRASYLPNRMIHSEEMFRYLPIWRWVSCCPDGRR